jgi:hypothetical protein
VYEAKGERGKREEKKREKITKEERRGLEGK